MEHPLGRYQYELRDLAHYNAQTVFSILAAMVGRNDFPPAREILGAVAVQIFALELNPPPCGYEPAW